MKDHMNVYSHIKPHSGESKSTVEKNLSKRKVGGGRNRIFKRAGREPAGSVCYKTWCLRPYVCTVGVLLLCIYCVCFFHHVEFGCPLKTIEIFSSSHCIYSWDEPVLWTLGTPDPSAPTPLPADLPHTLTV